MKNMLLAILLAGIVAISGCTQQSSATDNTNQQEIDNTPPAPNETKLIAEQTAPEGLTEEEIADAREYIRDLHKDYNITEFISTDQLTSITIYNDYYRTTDIVKMFVYLIERSKSLDYHIKIVNDRGSTENTKDDIICEYGDSFYNLEDFESRDWVGWQDDIAIITC